MNLVVGSSESPLYVLVIQYLNLEREVSPHVLDNHNQKWKPNGQYLFWIRRGCYEIRAHIGAHYLQYTGLYVLVCASLYMSILHW